MTKRTREDWLDEDAASSSDDSKLWTKLWKISVQSKIRHFLWRLMQHSLPTGDVRQRCNVAVSAACSMCGQEYS
jgi:hypothetical protein